MRRLWVAWIAASALAGGAAGAQDVVPEDRVERARARYHEGLGHIEAGRWADAAEAFRASYRLLDNPASLYNLGTALRALGRHVDTRDVLTRMLADHPEIEPETRGAAREMLEESAARIARLRVLDLPRDPALVLRLDDRAVPAAQGGVRLELDPGPHVLRVSRPGFEPFVHRLRLEDGGEAEVRVEMRRVRRRFLPWLVVAAAVVAASGALAAGLLTRDAPLQPGSSDRIRL